jgi:hypothetical protein
LIEKISDSVGFIAAGRKGLDTKGEAEAGQVSYHIGLADAMSVFQEIAVSADAEALVLVELAFLTEEKRFCDPSDAVAIGSLTAAIGSFDDALLALKAVGNTVLYAGIEMGFPHNNKHRVDKMPKDAFHIACIAHRTRLKNIQSAPGLNMLEKAIYKQRSANMSIAQKVYIGLQKNILS